MSALNTTFATLTMFVRHGGSSEAVPRTDASYRSIAATRDQPAVGARGQPAVDARR